MSKKFDVSPADRFLSSVSTSPTTNNSTVAKDLPKGYKINPEYIETKSKKLQCLIKPSDFEALKKKAQAMGVSVNSLVNDAIELFLQK